jgi:hypothetical protein
MKVINFTRGGGLRGDGGAAAASEQPPSPFPAVPLANTRQAAQLVAAPTIYQSPSPTNLLALAHAQPNAHAGFSPLHYQRSVI